MDAGFRRHPQRVASRWTTTLLAAALLGGSMTLTASTHDEELLAARAMSVAALSDAGRRLYARCDCTPRIGELLDAADKIRSEALATQSTGQTAAALERYNQAYQLLKLTLRSIAEQSAVAVVPGLPASESATDTHRARRASAESTIDSLLRAYEPLAAPNDLRDMNERIERLRFDANLAWDAAEYDRALLNLEVAYLQLKLAIVPLRDGQTLVRTLTFETPLDEYRYEVDRHDAHLLLVNLLLEADPDDPAEEARVRAEVDASMTLHWQAHRHAEAGDHARAIASLEQATAVLIRLLRTSGVEIPL